MVVHAGKNMDEHRLVVSGGLKMCNLWRFKNACWQS